jgi:hypothetical protein
MPADGTKYVDGLHPSTTHVRINPVTDPRIHHDRRHHWPWKDKGSQAADEDVGIQADAPVRQKTAGGVTA